MVLQGKNFWLGGLDSNQDSQIQSLESYQLDDLPTVESALLTSCHGLEFWVKRVRQNSFCSKIHREIGHSRKLILHAIRTKMRLAANYFFAAMTVPFLDHSDCGAGTRQCAGADACLTTIASLEAWMAAREIISLLFSAHLTSRRCFLAWRSSELGSRRTERFPERFKAA